MNTLPQITVGGGGGGMLGCLSLARRTVHLCKNRGNWAR